MPSQVQVVWTLIVGLVVGAIGKPLLLPATDPAGVLITMLLGVDGGFLAAFVGRSLGFYGPNDTGPRLVASVVGAISLLGIYRLAFGRRRTIA